MTTGDHQRNPFLKKILRTSRSDTHFEVDLVFSSWVPSQNSIRCFSMCSQQKSCPNPSDLTKGKPLQSLGSGSIGALNQLHTLHSSIALVPRVIANRSEDLPGLLKRRVATNLHDAPGVVGVDSKGHRMRRRRRSDQPSTTFNPGHPLPMIARAERQQDCLGISPQPSSASIASLMS